VTGLKVGEVQRGHLNKMKGISVWEQWENIKCCEATVLLRRLSFVKIHGKYVATTLYY
jgi:hypothetical protein